MDFKGVYDLRNKYQLFLLGLRNEKVGVKKIKLELFDYIQQLSD